MNQHSHLLLWADYKATAKIKVLKKTIMKYFDNQMVHFTPVDTICPAGMMSTGVSWARFIGYCSPPLSAPLDCSDHKQLDMALDAHN